MPRVDQPKVGPLIVVRWQVKSTSIQTEVDSIVYSVQTNAIIANETYKLRIETQKYYSSKLRHTQRNEWYAKDQVR
jgi:hypothetical protein